VAPFTHKDVLNFEPMTYKTNQNIDTVKNKFHITKSANEKNCKIFNENIKKDSEHKAIKLDLKPNYLPDVRTRLSKLPPITSPGRHTMSPSTSPIGLKSSGHFTE